jgi:hypothetical protein
LFHKIYIGVLVVGKWQVMRLVARDLRALNRTKL